MQTRVPKKRAAAPRTPLQTAVKDTIARAAGGGSAGKQDPLSALTEEFHMNFDKIGQRRAQELAGDGQEQEKQKPEARQAQTGKSEKNAEQGEKKESGPLFQGYAKPVPMMKFAEAAFSRGTLSAALLEGTGKMALVSCLKRTCGDNADREKSLFNTGGQSANLDGHGADKVVFRRSFVNSAVGLVVDTLSDARNAVDDLSQLIRGGQDTGSGAEMLSLRMQYPFLDDSRERELAAAYEEQLKTCDDRERPILQNALVHARAAIDRKAQLKTEFLNKLRFLSDRAEEAQKDLEDHWAETASAQLNIVEEEEEDNRAGNGDADGPPDDRGRTGDGEPETDAADGDAVPVGGDTGDTDGGQQPDTV